MKKIVYATNFSENSVTALKYTHFIRGFFKADVIVLHIFETENSDENSEAEKQQLAEQKKRLQNFCSTHLGDEFENLNLTVAIVKGTDIIKEILKFIRDMNLQMLIMGASQAGPVKEFFLGSATKQVLSLSPFPVLVVPAEYAYKKPARILYFTDFEEFDIYNISELVELFATLEVRIIVVHVAEKEEEQINNLLEWFRETVAEKVYYPEIEYKLILSNDVVGSLRAFIDKMDIDIVAMLERHQMQDIKKVLHRDVVKRIQSDIKVPLLGFRKDY